MDGDQRRLLGTMPLHAITSTYGEAGLRDRFAVEIASWSEADQRRMERALDLAARLQADDRRGRERAVTTPPYAPDRDQDEQYREHVADSLRDNPWARIIKASDFTDNGVGLIHTTGPRLYRLAGKYAPLVPVLQDLISRPDTPLDPAAKKHILAQP